MYTVGWDLGGTRRAPILQPALPTFVATYDLIHPGIDNRAINNSDMPPLTLKFVL